MGFLSFTKNISKNIGKYLSRKYTQKPPNGQIFAGLPPIQYQNSTLKICRCFIDYKRRIHLKKINTDLTLITRRRFDFQNQ